MTAYAVIRFVKRHSQYFGVPMLRRTNGMQYERAYYLDEALFVCRRGIRRVIIC